MSTFLLAIGAYILYKVREKRSRGAVPIPQPSTVKAEVVVPNVVVQRQPEVARGASQAGYEQQYGAMPYQQARQAQYAQQPPRYTGETPQYVPGPADAEMGYGPQEADERQQQHTDSKFLKYTSEGYVPAKEDKSQGALRWR
jgi:hypothetical protein